MLAFAAMDGRVSVYSICGMLHRVNKAFVWFRVVLASSDRNGRRARVAFHARSLETTKREKGMKPVMGMGYVETTLTVDSKLWSITQHLNSATVSLLYLWAMCWTSIKHKLAYTHIKRTQIVSQHGRGGRAEGTELESTILCCFGQGLCISCANAMCYSPAMFNTLLHGTF